MPGVTVPRSGLLVPEPSGSPPSLGYTVFFHQGRAVLNREAICVTRECGYSAASWLHSGNSLIHVGEKEESDLVVEVAQASFAWTLCVRGDEAILVPTFVVDERVGHLFVPRQRKVERIAVCVKHRALCIGCATTQFEDYLEAKEFISDNDLSEIDEDLVAAA